MKPLLVGEVNPHGPDPSFALYHTPERSAGGRLCRLVMGLQRARYEAAYDRVNLCVEKWSLPLARDRAGALAAGRAGSASPEPAVVVLLGSRVCSAFGRAYAPFTAEAAPVRSRAGAHLGAALYVVLPHPSGLCRAWNAPGSFSRARELLRSAGCEVGEALEPGVAGA